MIMTIVSRLWMMSLQACALILIVLLARYFLKKYPKVYSYCLWILVGVRLLCPVFIEAPFSLQPELPGYSQAVREQEDSAKKQGGGSERLPKAQDGKTDGQGQSALLSGIHPEKSADVQPEGALHPEKTSNVRQPSDPRTGVPTGASNAASAGDGLRSAAAAPVGAEAFRVTAVIYLAGVGVVFCIYAAQYLRMKHRIALAVREQGNVWLCERVEAPFVIGVVAPKILLPYDLSEQEKYHVLRHERTHIRHHDPLIRFAGVFCICLHWWNPLVWLAVCKMNQDMEMFCDETALRRATAEDRKAYANALLSFAAKRSGFSPGLAFGESNTEKRVRNIMRKRKKSLMIVLLVALLAAFCACAFMTSPKEDGNTDVPAAAGSNGTPEDDEGSSKQGKEEDPDGNQDGNQDAVLTGGITEIQLTDEDVAYLAQICPKLPEFSGEEEMDISFWENYLFYTYTSDFDKEMASRYSEQRGFEASYVKVSAAEADRTAGQIFGKALSECVKDPQELGKETDNIHYEDGYYYIAVSDSPDYIFELEETQTSDGVTRAAFLAYAGYETEAFSRLTLYLVPAENERGFVVAGKTGEIFSSGGGNQILWNETSNIGTWYIPEYFAPGIYALSEDEIANYCGYHIVYAEDYFCLKGSEPQKVEGYRQELLTAGEFEELYITMNELYGANGGELEFSTVKVNRYEAIGVQDAPFGSFFYQIDYDNALIFCEGVFFRAVRVETEEEDTDTNSNPQENGTGSETEGGRKCPVGSEREAMLAAYTSVLESFYFDHTPPDGESYGFWEGADISDNRFALYDVDGDGKDELIVVWVTTYTAGNVIIVYGFDAASNTTMRELLEYPAVTFYDNGIIKAKASHNHGRSMLEGFWPYALYQYDPDSDSYIGTAEVDAWDRSYDETDFPEEADIDGDGVLYYVMPYGNYAYEAPSDFEAYNQWWNSCLEGAEEIDVPYVPLTEENIHGMKFHEMK